MNRFRFLVLAAMLAAVPAAICQEAPPAENFTAEEVIQRVLISRAMQNNEVLKGSFTKGRTTVPFTITLQTDLLRFGFTNPLHYVNLNITEKGSRLTESISGRQDAPVAPQRYTEGVRGTDLTYDDLSQRFLYWPKKTKVGVETIKTRRCDVVDLYNPDNLGEYYLVRIFADQESGGMLRMMGFDRNGKLIKVCAVTAGMKLKSGATVLKSMEIVRYEPGTKKVLGETTLELKKP